MQGTAEMIFSGDELLRGDTLNSNQAWLGERLLDLGVFATRALSVTDEQASIVEAIHLSLSHRPDVLVLSGGLGPTDDDLTREAVAEALGRRLIEQADLLRQIEARFEQLGMTMSDTNRKQALLPAGSAAIPMLGTAPGFWLVEGPTLVVALPGVPRELQSMWEEHVEPLLQARLCDSSDHLGGAAIVRYLRVYGMGESTLAEALRGLSWRGGPVEIGTRADLSGLELVLRARPTAEATAEMAALEGQVRQILGDKVFGTREDSLAGVVGRLLRERGLTLVTAESCTGGLIAKLLTDVPGSSEYFAGGVVSYSNRLKSSLLGIDPMLIDTHGAVSEPVAAAMAEGARTRLGADCALAVTGIAGPGGGTAEKPVGLVYVGTAVGFDVRVRRFTLFRGRDEIRQRSAYTALDVLRRRLLDELPSAGS